MSKRTFSSANFGVLENTSTPSAFMPSDLSRTLGPAGDAASYVSAGAKRMRIAGAANPEILRSIFPIPWEDGMSDIRSGDLLFHMGRPPREFKKAAGERSLAEYLLPFASVVEFLKIKYNNAVESVYQYVAQGLTELGLRANGSTITGFMGFYDEGDEYGAEENSAATSASAVNLMKKKRKIRNRKMELAHEAILREDLILDLDQLRYIFKKKNPRADMQMLYELSRAEDEMEQWFQNRLKFLESIRESEEAEKSQLNNVRGVGGEDTATQETFTAIKGQLTEAYADLLDEYQVDKNTDKATALYDLETVVQEDWRYLCPDLTYNSMSFAGCVDIAANEKKFLPSLKVDEPKKSASPIGLKSYGLSYMTNIVSAEIGPADIIYCYLERAYDPLRQMFTQVRPSFVFGKTEQLAFANVQCQKEKYRSHVDFEMKERVIDPVSDKPCVFKIGMVKEQQAPGNTDEQSFLTAQLKDPKKNLKDALGIRQKMPITNVYISI